jgi:hypothetical protein
MHAASQRHNAQSHTRLAGIKVSQLLIKEAHTIVSSGHESFSHSFSSVLVWLLLFGGRIKEFIYNSNNYLFGCYGIGYRIYLEFDVFSSHA